MEGLAPEASESTNKGELAKTIRGKPLPHWILNPYQKTEFNN